MAVLPSPRTRKHTTPMEAGRDDLQARVLSHESLELFGELHVAADVGLDAADAVQTQDEPQLQRTEAATQCQGPVAEVRQGYFGRFEVRGVNLVSRCQETRVANPERATVEVDQHPLVGVEAERT